MEQQQNESSIQGIDFDVVMYSGGISVDGYEELCEAIERIPIKAKKCLLMIDTPGGDPNAGFRIARALHHNYDSFDVLVPRYCKSAGTLICTGASYIYMDDMSELGPLDIQVKKEDEIFSRNSGLDIIQALNNLQASSISTLKEVLIELTARATLSTKVASEIACKLTSGIYEPIYAQIDPIKIAEMHRATSIAFSYGSRLNEQSNNLLHDGLSRLVLHYPSHGFVIDRKEARTIFARVGDAKSETCRHLKKIFEHLTSGGIPIVNVLPKDFVEKIISERIENETGNSEANAAGDGQVQPTVDETSEGNPDPIAEAAANDTSANVPE